MGSSNKRMQKQHPQSPSSKKLKTEHTTPPKDDTTKNIKNLKDIDYATLRFISSYFNLPVSNKSSSKSLVKQLKDLKQKLILMDNRGNKATDDFDCDSCKKKIKVAIYFLYFPYRTILNSLKITYIYNIMHREIGIIVRLAKITICVTNASTSIPMTSLIHFFAFQRCRNHAKKKRRGSWHLRLLHCLHHNNKRWALTPAISSRRQWRIV